VLPGIKADCAYAKHGGDNQNEDTHSSVFSLISIRLGACRIMARISVPVTNPSRILRH
jgi:hypothetical protein